MLAHQMPDLETSTVQREGWEIACEIEGPVASADRTAVFLHGFGTSRRSMRGLAGMLRGSGVLDRTIALDLRGHGATRAPAEGAEDRAWSYPQMRDDLLAVIAEHAQQGPHLVGHSMGGQVALLAAIASPDLARSLTTIGAGPCRPVLEERERRSWERAAGFFERAALEVLASSLAEAAATAYGDRDDLAPMAVYGDARGAEVARVVRGGFLHVEDNEDDCRALRTPSLVLVGENDAQWLEPSRRLAALVPGATLRVFERAGHLLHLEEPQAVAEAIGAFVRAL